MIQAYFTDGNEEEKQTIRHSKIFTYFKFVKRIFTKKKV